MTELRLDYEVPRSAHDVERLLLDPAFLMGFVSQQHPQNQSIVVDTDMRVSTLNWTIDLDGDIPGVVARFVGYTVAISLVFDLGAKRMRLRAQARRNAVADCALLITPQTIDRCQLAIDGSIGVSGAFGGLAESTARDQVIAPVFKEDLIPMLTTWDHS